MSRNKLTITPSDELITEMPVWMYLGYRPWTRVREHDDEVIFLSKITRLSDMPQAMKNLFGNNQRYLNGLCRQNAQAQETGALEELEEAYYNGEFLRDPYDEIEDNPLDEASDEGYDDHNWYMLPDEQVDMILLELEIRRLYAIGRARDLMEEARENLPGADDTQIVEILNGLQKWIREQIPWKHPDYHPHTFWTLSETHDEVTHLLSCVLYEVPDSGGSD